MGFKFRVDGGRRFSSAIAKTGKDSQQAITDALIRAGYLVEGAAKIKIVEMGAVDTGTTKNSITAGEVQETSEGMYIPIGPSTEYAIFIEMGTYKMGARPFMRKALEQNEKEIVKLVHQTLSEYYKI